MRALLTAKTGVFDQQYMNYNTSSVIYFVKA